MSYAIYEKSHTGAFNGVLTKMDDMIYPSPLLEIDTMFFDTAEDAINYVFEYRLMVKQHNEARLKLLSHDVVKINPKIEFYMKLSQKVKYLHPDEFIDEVVHTIE